MVAVPPPTAEAEPQSARSAKSAKKSKSLSSDKGKGGSKSKKGGAAAADGSAVGRLELPEDALSVAGGVILIGGCMAGGHAAPLTEAWVFSADSRQWYNVPTSVDAGAVSQWLAASTLFEGETAELLPGVVAVPTSDALQGLPAGSFMDDSLQTSTFTAAAGAVNGGSDEVLSPPAGRAAAAVRWIPPQYPLEGAVAWDPALHGPCPRTGHSMAINAEHDTVFLFGGRDSCGRPLNDTWSLDVGSWEWAPVIVHRVQAQLAPPQGGQGGLSDEALATVEEDGLPDAPSVPGPLPAPRAWSGLVWAHIPECALKPISTPLYTLADAPKDSVSESPRGGKGSKSKKGGKKSPRDKGGKGGNKASESMGGASASLGAPPGSPWGLVPCLLMYGGASSRGIAQGILWALQPGAGKWHTVDVLKLSGAASGTLPSLGARYGHSMLCLPVSKVVPGRVLEAELAAAEEAVEAAAVSLSSSGGKGAKGGKSLKGGVPDVSSFTLDDATNAAGQAVRTVHRLVVLGGVTQGTTGGGSLSSACSGHSSSSALLQEAASPGGWVLDLNPWEPPSAPPLNTAALADRVQEMNSDELPEDGAGAVTFPDGSRYVGRFQQNMRWGEGRCRFANGDVYEGEWRNDRPHGEGMGQWAATGSTYNGGWKGGSRVGTGSIQHPGKGVGPSELPQIGGGHFDMSPEELFSGLAPGHASSLGRNAPGFVPGSSRSQSGALGSTIALESTLPRDGQGFDGGASDAELTLGASFDVSASSGGGTVQHTGVDASPDSQHTRGPSGDGTLDTLDLSRSFTGGGSTGHGGGGVSPPQRAAMGSSHSESLTSALRDSFAATGASADVSRAGTAAVGGIAASLHEDARLSRSADAAAMLRSSSALGVSTVPAQRDTELGSSQLFATRPARMAPCNEEVVLTNPTDIRLHYVRAAADAAASTTMRLALASAGSGAHSGKHVQVQSGTVASPDVLARSGGAGRGAYGSSRGGGTLAKSAFAATVGSAQIPSAPPCASYEGGWHGDVRDGTGTAVYCNGDKYTGEWELGQRSGWGTIEYGGEGSYTGQWRHDVRWGQGTEETGGGDSFEGGFEADLRHGHGVLRCADGSQYVGAFKYGKRAGVGEGTSAAMDRVVGKWADDAACGLGTVVYGNGDRFNGMLSRGVAHGRGTLVTAAGATYTGDFEFGVRSGQGTCTLQNGTVYVGAWRKGVRHGHGRSDVFGMEPPLLVRRYEGAWAGDKETGRGAAVWPLHASSDPLEDGTAAVKPGLATLTRHSQSRGSSDIGRTAHMELESKAAMGAEWGGDEGVQWGDRYDGQWGGGVMQGRGCMWYGEGGQGGVYEGEWKGGLRHGQGRLTRQGGVDEASGRLGGLLSYEGQWWRGTMTGQGTAVYSNGDEYTGAFVGGQRHGEGVLTSGNGDVFEGAFHQDKKHGRGVMTPGAGGRYAGPWAGDSMHVGQEAVDATKAAAAAASGTDADSTHT